MHVLARSTTSARPRAGSPALPVSDSVMASAEMVYGRSSCALAANDIASVAAISHVPVMLIADLAKRFHRNRFKPGLRLVGFTLSHLNRCVHRAREASALHLGKNVIPRLICP